MSFLSHLGPLLSIFGNSFGSFCPVLENPKLFKLSGFIESQLASRFSRVRKCPSVASVKNLETLQSVSLIFHYLFWHVGFYFSSKNQRRRKMFHCVLVRRLFSAFCSSLSPYEFVCVFQALLARSLKKLSPSQGRGRCVGKVKHLAALPDFWHSPRSDTLDRAKIWQPIDLQLSQTI